MSTKTYLFHELSSIFPLMEGEEFDALVEDMRKNGQLKKGILYEEKIIDGRNRYRACKILKIPFKTEEYSEKISPRDYIISENLHRRHLTIAQRAEIGLILLAEEEKKAKERMAKIGSEIGKVVGRGKEKIDETQKGILSKKIDEISKGSSSKIVAPKVRISDRTLIKAKKIKEVAKEDKKIAGKWEEAKRGKIGVDAVYKKVQEKEIIEKLPEDLKKEVEKKELTIKEAKDVAESYKEPELRKEAVKVVKKEKKEHERTMDYIKKVGTGEAKLPKKEYIDINQRIVKQFQDISKQIILKMSMNNIKGYNKETQTILIRIMKKCLEHLQNELKIKGEIISV